MNQLIIPDNLGLEFHLDESEHPAKVFIRRYTSDNTKRTMQGCLDRIAWLMIYQRFPDKDDKIKNVSHEIDWSRLRYKHTSGLRSILASQYGETETTNAHLAALRGVLKESWQLEQMTSEDYHRAVNISNFKVVKEGNAVGRALTTTEIAQLLYVCFVDPSPAGARDGAIIASLCVGLRRSEVVNLNYEDYQHDESRLIIRQSKGNKSRSIYMPQNGLAYMKRWIDRRKNQPGALFNPCYDNAIKVSHENMKPQAIYDIVIGKRAIEAGITDFTIHDFRRTFIGNMLEITDAATVAKLAGHGDINTTMGYDRRKEKVKRDAVEALYIPPMGSKE